MKNINADYENGWQLTLNVLRNLLLNGNDYVDENEFVERI